MVDYTSDPNLQYELYLYKPNYVPAIIFIVVYFLLLVLQIYHWINYRQNGNNKDIYRNIPNKIKRDYILIMLPAFVGNIFEIVGFITRMIGHDHKQALGPYIVQSLTLLLAPPLYAATIYMSYGRCLKITDTKSFIIKTKWITTFFVIGDVFSFFVQAAGGGLMANAGSLNSGKNIVIVGLIIQIIFFGFFMISIVKTIFTLTSHKHTGTKFNWKTFFTLLLISSLFILIRSIYRIIEFVEGRLGYLMTHEWSLYVFDSAMIFIAAFCIISFNLTVYLSNLYNEMKEQEILVQNESYSHKL